MKSPFQVGSFRVRIVAIRLAVAAFVFSAAAGAVCGQPAAVSSGLVASRRTATIAAAQVESRVRRHFGGEFGAGGARSVALYRISYRSAAPDGRAVVLSGLVALPDGKEAPRGLVVYNHGTTTDLALSPSNYAGADNAGEAALATLAFASGGYVVAMPDYLGLGDDKSTFHPYPLGAVNAASAVDIIAPARALAAARGVELADALFVTGYSEGGAVAMWTARRIESRADLALTAAAPLSGPYDLSGTTRRWLLAPTPDAETFVVRLFLLSYMVQSFHKNAGAKLTDYFKPSMALTVAQAYKTHRKDEDVIKRLALAATLMRAKNSLAGVLTPRFLDALRDADKTDPVIRELAANDAYDWRPRSPLLLVSLAGDKVVDAANSEVAWDNLRGRGKVEREVIRDAKLNHLTAVAPALAKARAFFDKQ